MCEFVSMYVCEFDLVSSDLKTSRGKSFFFVEGMEGVKFR